jgi:L-ascorbate metabolism protein UlaG (beta-lactamase superfamily)
MSRRKFTNPDPSHRPHGPAAILRWGVIDRLRGRRLRSRPGPPAPAVQPDLDLIRSADIRPRLTWIGHASFLGSLDGTSFLVDPVFSRHAGVLYPRYLAPGLGQSDLPAIGAVMVTHNHYDHLDAGAIRGLAEQVPVVAPAGMGGWLERQGRDHVLELGWWQSAEVNGLRITLVPSCHWSRRGILDTNRALWGGYVVESGDQRLYHAGDTAYFDGFREIADRFPGLLAAMLPIGGYRPAWFMEHYHLNPEQAGRAYVDLGARYLVPMHWGTFQLTDEPLCEPEGRMRAWWQGEGRGDGRALKMMAVGETIILE